MFQRENLKPHIALEIGSIESIKTFVMNNLGITLLPIMSATKELDNGILVNLDLIDSEFNMVSQVLYHKNKWITATIKAFIEEIKFEYI